jgi:hypothetical protein
MAAPPGTAAPDLDLTETALRGGSRPAPIARRGKTGRLGVDSPQTLRSFLPSVKDGNDLEPVATHSIWDHVRCA